MSPWRRVTERLLDIRADAALRKHFAPPDEAIPSSLHEGFEVIAPSGNRSPIIVTAEHGSTGLPLLYSWPEEDLSIVSTHLGVDAGAEEFAREFARFTSSYYLMSRVSRLFCDYNNPIWSPNVFAFTLANGRDILLNRRASADNLKDRIDYYYHPYHAMLKKLMKSYKSKLALSIQTFHPIDPSTRRLQKTEVCLLYDKDPALAEKVGC